MIALIVALALVLVWASVATGVAVANDQRAKFIDRAFQAATQRVADLEDRQQASSLSEFHASRAIAMQPREPMPDEQWDYDSTGLIRTKHIPLEGPVEEPNPWD